MLSNLNLLRELYEIHAPSHKEGKMREYIKHLLPKGVEYTEDYLGNLYITKGMSPYPCVVAHLDQVQQFHPKDFRTVIINDIIIGWSDKHKRQCGLGADDKNGIFIALNCLERFENIKVAFFVSEEVGCVGSSRADLDFFSDCRFIIEPDRRGGRDLITTMCGVKVCSEEFIQDIDYQRFDYRQTHGSITDVLELVERGVGLSCINLSCGYYNPHTDEETTLLPELENCQELVFSIIENCKKTYPFGSDYFLDEYEDYNGYDEYYKNWFNY